MFLHIPLCVILASRAHSPGETGQAYEIQLQSFEWEFYLRREVGAFFSLVGHSFHLRRLSFSYFMLAVGLVVTETSLLVTGNVPPRGGASSSAYPCKQPAAQEFHCEYVGSM